MPKNEKEINTPEAPDDATDAKAVQKWQVWTQGPKDAKETKRKFKLTTPGQERDYKKLVGKRKFQRFEAVEQEDEDAAANSVAGGGVDMAPNASGTKVWMKRRRLGVDGRSKAYRAATKRIKERNAKANEKDAVKKLSQFGVTNNPFAEEKEMDDNKYLKTKEGSIEQAALDSVEMKSYNPNTERPTLRLPKNRYLDTKEDSLESAVVKAVEAHEPGHKEKSSIGTPLKHKRSWDPKTHKLVQTPSGSKVVRKDDKKYSRSTEAESVETDEAAGVAGSSASKLSVAQKIKNAAKVKSSGMDMPRTITVKHEAAGKASSIAGIRRARTPIKSITIHHEEDDDEKKNLPPWLKGKSKPGKGSTSDTDDDEYDKDEKRFDKQRERKRGASSSSGLKKFRFKNKEDEDEDPVGKKQDEVWAPSKEIDRTVKFPTKGVKKHEWKPRPKKAKKEEVEMDENGNHPPKGRHQHPGQKKGSAKLKKGWGMTQSGEPYFKPNSNRPTKESKEVTSGERDLGSDEYANYVKTLTPGEKAETGVHDRDARKAEVKQKKEKAVQNHQATRIDDVFDHQKLGFDTRADMLEFVLQHTGETEVTDENITSVYEILSGMTPKKSTPIPAGAKPTVLKPSLKGMPPRRKELVKKSNTAAKSGAIKPAGSSTEAVEVESLIAQAVAELSKKTLGSYVKKASVDKSNAGITLGQTSASGKQTQADVQKHAGKMIKRQKGIDKAADKLSKEDKDKPEQGKVYALTGKSSTANIARGDSWKDSEVKKKEKSAYQKNIDYDTARHAAKTRKHEETEVSMVDTVKEVLGHAGWAGLGNMPPTDPKTGKYVTGKTKIKRLPYDKNNPSKKPEKK